MLAESDNFLGQGLHERLERSPSAFLSGGCGRDEPVATWSTLRGSDPRGLLARCSQGSAKHHGYSRSRGSSPPGPHAARTVEPCPQPPLAAGEETTGPAGKREGPNDQNLIGSPLSETETDCPVAAPRTWPEINARPIQLELRQSELFSAHHGFPAPGHRHADSIFRFGQEVVTPFRRHEPVTSPRLRGGQGRPGSIRQR